ncbi:pentapeptide repeat-containing protein [Rhizobium leguminosarum]|nr:pentapeptide repeat-containing protein [Rhizobium leguminosarum]
MRAIPRENAFFGTWTATTAFTISAIQIFVAPFFLGNTFLPAFREANLEGADFSHCNVKTSDFSRANLALATFFGSAIDAAVFDGADLTGTIFEGASAFGYVFGKGELPPR